MPEQKRFNWDVYVSKTHYRKVLEGMEGVRSIMPTMFSPDRKKVYLASQDVALDADDIKRLSRIFDIIYDDLRWTLGFMRWSCEKAYLLQVDYLTVWSLLYKQNALPDDYKYPEYYLEKFWREIRPVNTNRNDKNNGEVI